MVPIFQYIININKHYKEELKNMEDILADLKSLIERGLDPLRKG